MVFGIFLLASKSSTNGSLEGSREVDMILLKEGPPKGCSFFFLVFFWGGLRKHVVFHLFWPYTPKPVSQWGCFGAYAIINYRGRFLGVMVS